MSHNVCQGPKIVGIFISIKNINCNVYQELEIIDIFIFIQNTSFNIY